LFNLQAAVLSLYHMKDPQAFYHGEDAWQIPQTADKEFLPAYYMVMKLPNEKGAEFILMLPFTPRNKDNLAAWMVARNDGKNYGRLTVYHFPKEKLVYGPRQIAARIMQDERISPQFTLWNQQGSEAHLGTLLVLPIEESMLYIQSLYLKAAQGQIPELKRVIVSYEDQIAMEPTFEEALDRIFKGSPPGRTVGRSAPVDSSKNPPSINPSGVGSEDKGTTATAQITGYAAEAKKHYEAATQAAREGNWARYGEEIRSLGEVIDRMNQKKQEPDTSGNRP